MWLLGLLLILVLVNAYILVYRFWLFCGYVVALASKVDI